MKTPYKPSKLAGFVHIGIAAFAGGIGAVLSSTVAVIDSGTRNAAKAIRDTAVDAVDAATTAYRGVSDKLKAKVFKRPQPQVVDMNTFAAATAPQDPPPVTAGGAVPATA